MKNVLSKIINFFKAVAGELRLVEFPSRKVTLRTGNIVILISVLLGISLYLVDWLFQLFRNFLTSIKF